MDNISIRDVIYRIPRHVRKTQHTKSIQLIGIDTETKTTGKCFLICTSSGDSFTPDDFPQCLFTRKYRNKKYAVYNLKFDEGSLIQHLPVSNLQQLRSTLKTSYNGYTYTSIPRKMFKIRRGKNCIEIYDVAGFYMMSLEKASRKYLGEGKNKLATKKFTDDFISKHYKKIVKYCIRDAVLTQRLATLLIEKFEQFGVYPQHLYSTAYVSWQYFKNNCDIPNIKHIYDYTPMLLQYAMDSYNGGKFEVTEKGTGRFYEYDIISAYPYEISRLVDISDISIMKGKHYEKEAEYGFIDCRLNIPVNVYSPVAVKRNNVNIYPVGNFRKVITKNEYDYLIKQGCDIDIIDAYWIIPHNRIYPFKDEINRLIKIKERYKRRGLKLDYAIIKIFLNSLYGKFVQLIPRGDKYTAGLNWNIIYGSVITANCRIRISELQQKYSSVIAVHTDSVISKKKLPFTDKGKLGDLIFEIAGNGVILGSGIYQISKKTKFRGFDTKVSLLKTIQRGEDELEVSKERPYSWREVIFHGWSKDLINQFVDIPKNVNINFDKKRIWIEDYKSYKEVMKRNVYSVPIPYIDYL